MNIYFGDFNAVAYISRVYGSKKGLLRLVRSRVIQTVGGYNYLFNIDFDRVERLVFVCKGNICRSAYADAYARCKGVLSTSCGIEAVAGLPANLRAITLGKARGVTLDEHLTQHLDAQHFTPADLLLGMEPAHVKPMQQAAHGAQISLLGLWGKQPRAYLHDPYSAPDDYFRVCLDLIECSVDALVGQCISLAKLSNDKE
jgi:protein-tyrosine phosphatase